MCIRIAGKACLWLTAMLMKVMKGNVVYLHESSLGTCLYAEVADGNTVTHGQVLHTVACKFHGFVVGSVGTDLADDGQNQVTGINTFRKLTGQIEAECLRNQNPGFAGYHGIEIVRTSYTGTEGTESSVGTGMAVRSEDQFTRADMVFHHDLMADTLSLIKFDAVLFCKITHFLLGSSGLRTVGGNVVVHDPHQFTHICDVGMF